MEIRGWAEAVGGMGAKCSRWRGGADKSADQCFGFVVTGAASFHAKISAAQFELRPANVGIGECEWQGYHIPVKSHGLFPFETEDPDGV